MVLTAKQVKTLAKIAEKHSTMEIESVGPLLAVTVYVQSASSSGNTVWYYNRDGEKVRT